MVLESSYRQGRLAPRCRLITSWLWRGFQGFVCSPIKVVRELGLERRETVRSLSAVGPEALQGCAVVREEPVQLGASGAVATCRRPRGCPRHREPLEAAKAGSGPAKPLTRQARYSLCRGGAGLRRRPCYLGLDADPPPELLGNLAPYLEASLSPG
jgi:hypothetical protein